MSKVVTGAVFILGLGAGYGLTQAFSPAAPPAKPAAPASSALTTAGTSALDREVARLKKENEQLLTALDTATKPPAAGDAEAKAPPQPRRGGMGGMGRGMSMNAQREASRLARRLNMSEEQSASAQKFLADRAERQSAYFGELFSSGRLGKILGGEADEAERKEMEEELARNRKEESATKFREHLASSLSAEQLANYDAYALNQKQNDAMVFASRQINEIGQNVDLDENQKDTLFAGYVKMAMESDADPRWAADAPPGMARSAVTGSLDMAYIPPVVQSTLNATQLAAYQQSVKAEAEQVRVMHKSDGK